MRRVGLVLAAGQSRRFGPGDKLLAPLSGRALCEHACATMRALALEARVAVANSPEVGAIFHAAGFEVRPPEGGNQQSDSLRAGVRAAQALGATQLLITLADMPFVPVAHLRQLLELGQVAPAASSDGLHALPPAVFPASHFAALCALSGDRGAGALIRDLPDTQLLALPPDALRDIDTPADLTGLAE